MASPRGESKSGLHSSGKGSQELQSLSTMDMERTPRNEEEGIFFSNYFFRSLSFKLIHVLRLRATPVLVHLTAKPFLHNPTICLWTRSESQRSFNKSISNTSSVSGTVLSTVERRMSGPQSLSSRISWFQGRPTCKHIAHQQ